MEEKRDTLSMPGLDIPNSTSVAELEVPHDVPVSPPNHQPDVGSFTAEHDSEQSCVSDGNRSSFEGSHLISSRVTDGANSHSQQLLTKNGANETCQADLESNCSLHEQRLLVSQGTSSLDHPSELSQSSSDKAGTLPSLTASVSEGTESEVLEKVMLENISASLTADAQSHRFSSSSNKDFSDEPNHTEITTLQTLKDQLTESKIDSSCDIDGQAGARGDFSDKLLDDRLSSGMMDNLQDAGESQRQTDNQSAIGHAASTEEEVSDKLRTAKEAKCGTEYLDSVISSINSLTSNQPDADKDTVKISRAELTLMVEQTLAAQTMCNYMEDLVQENKMLNQQNEVLKDTIVQTRQWQGGKLNSFPLSSQGTEAQIFRFPGSLPPMLNQSSTSGNGTSLPSHQKNVQHPSEQEETISFLQADGEISASLQLSSQISFDGDPDHSKETSAAGQLIHTINNTEAEAAFLTQPLARHNIPNTELFAEAHCYSQGPQQREESVVGARVLQEKASVMGAGVSLEKFKIVTDELEKRARFVNKITTEAGISPDCVHELVNLRDKVNKLVQENYDIKIELENRCVPGKDGITRQQYDAEIRDLKMKLQQQKIREDGLAILIGKLRDANKQHKTGGMRPPSQPSSSVGLPALPTISVTSTTSVKCQTEESFEGIEELAAEADSRQKAMKIQHQNELQAYQTERAMLNGQLIQARTHETELSKAVEKLHSELTATKEDNVQLQRSVHQKIQELAKRCEELTQQKDRQERKLSQEAERNKQMKKIIDDERKRYSRDEKELLDRVKVLTEMIKPLTILKQLVLAVDNARMEGIPLPQDCADQVTALRNQNLGDTPTTTQSSTFRTAVPRGGASGMSSGSSTTASAHMASASKVSQRVSSQQGSGHRTVGHSSGKGTHASPNLQAEINATPGASLPNLSGQHLQQYAGQATSQGNKTRPVQRSNLANSSTSVSSSVNSSKQRHQ